MKWIIPLIKPLRTWFLISSSLKIPWNLRIDVKMKSTPFSWRVSSNYALESKEEEKSDRVSVEDSESEPDLAELVKIESNRLSIKKEEGGNKERLNDKLEKKGKKGKSKWKK